MRMIPQKYVCMNRWPGFSLCFLGDELTEQYASRDLYIGSTSSNKRSFTLKRCHCIKVVIWPYLRHQHNNACPLVEASRDHSLQSGTGGCSCWGNASEWWLTPRRPDGLKMGSKAMCQGLCVRVCVCLRKSEQLWLKVFMKYWLRSWMRVFPMSWFWCNIDKKTTAPSLFFPHFILFAV